MDGLLLDSEDKYTLCTNAILKKYNKPPIPWSIKAQLQGRPGPQAGAIFHEWAQLPISKEEYLIEQTALQKELFPSSLPLPGVEKLLSDLKTAKTKEGALVHVALATSSHSTNFKLKTDHLEDLFSVFKAERRVLGDDTRIPAGKGKPAPDIYELALKMVNESLEAGEREIKKEECLVFEDSVPGVEAGRRAGMRVVWVPHIELLGEYREREAEVLAGTTGQGAEEGIGGEVVGEVNDGWAERLDDLVAFPYERFGIVVGG
ncbi:hypothetical protein B7494_g7766 [Chlorociboria aeruginascens]|nr:hypothetical protein B7494_g7766 [Chlorociboria aeruginascens]